MIQLTAIVAGTVATVLWVRGLEAINILFQQALKSQIMEEDKSAIMEYNRLTRSSANTYSAEYR